VTRTNALESLVISGWVRSLSDRDIEASLAEVLGPEAALSRSTVSRICRRIRDELLNPGPDARGPRSERHGPTRARRPDRRRTRR
jgi:hypothetical protein